MAHRTTIKVRFADLDPYDHVNHARYLTYFESARIEALDEIGFGMDTMKAAGVQIVLVELTVRYWRAARLHDELEIVTWVEEVGRATSRWRQRACLDRETVAEADIFATFTDLRGRPRRAPAGFAEAAARFDAPAGT